VNVSDPARMIAYYRPTSIDVLDFAGEVRAIDDPATPNTNLGRGAIDMGAHEFQPTPCRADFNGDGVLNIFDFLGFQSAFGNGC